jgi:hypothetical protein
MADISSLRRQAEALLTKMNEGKQFSLKEVVATVAEASDAYPRDTVIRAMYGVLTKLAQKHPGGIISQSDMEQIYQNVVGLNTSGTKFREVLGHLLKDNLNKTAHYNEDYVKSMRDTPEMGDIEMGSADPEVKQAMAQLFDKKYDIYKHSNVEKAHKKVVAELNAIGFKNPKVSLAGGNSKYIVFASDIDTTRGALRILIPADASGEKFPSVFVASNHCDVLTKTAIYNYINNPEAVNNVKLPDVPETYEVKASQKPVPKALRGIVEDLEESVVETSVGFSQTVVRNAKLMLDRELRSAGFHNSRIKVAGSTSDGFILEATLNGPHGGFSIEAPIEVSNNMPLMPSVFAKGDKLSDFNEMNLRIASQQSENSLNAVMSKNSDFVGLSKAELKDALIKSALAKDYDTCDEVINVVAQKFDGGVYKSFVADYNQILTSVDSTEKRIRTAYEEDKHLFVKSPNSIYPIHKKLGRPLNELVRDENGEYHIASTYYARQNQQEEGVFFNTSKILVGD